MVRFLPRALLIGTFMIIITSALFLIHLYSFSRIFSFLGIERRWWFWVIVTVLPLSFIIANIIERTLDGPIGKVSYIIAVTWLGSIFILFCVTALVDVLNILLKMKLFWIGWFILGTWLAIVMFSLFNASVITTREVNISIHGLKENIKAIHLSDIHLGAVQNAPYATEIVEKINKIKPDIVFITGDLADGSGAFTNDTVKPFNAVKAPIFYVTGNHENYLGLDDVLKIVNTTKIKTLRGEVVSFKGVQIVGFDYPMEGSGKKLSLMFKKVKLKKNEPIILLYHAPQELEDAKKAGVNLMLSGHVHGGQIIPFNLLVRTIFPYTGGLHDYKGMNVFVSTGTGTWGPPMRLGSNNEIVVLNIGR